MNTTPPDGLHRGLKARHIELITLGGIIGSAYFLGTGQVVGQVGPAAFLAYILGGVIIYLTMLCMGELAVAMPVSGSFITYAADYISPAVACAAGWSYWLNWVLYIPAECVAAGIIMQAFTGINGYIWGICFGLLITFINLCRVSIFGEVEFWLSIIKIFALVGFVILAVCIFFGVVRGPQATDWIGAQYLYHQSGLLPHGGLSLLTAMVLMLVNYQGSEIIGIAAGESQCPEKTIPKAIKRVVIRILGLYILPVFCLVLIFPWDQASLANSVFAEALDFYGIHWAASMISFVTLAAALSCANSGYYSTVRALHALARHGMAPSMLTKLNRHHSPHNAIFVTLVSIWLVLVLGYFFGEYSFYLALLLVSGFTGTICWIVLCWAQIRFRQHWLKQGHKLAELKYLTPGSPYTGIIAIILMIFALFMLVFDSDTIYRLAFGIGIACVSVPAIAYRLWIRHRRIHTV